MLFVSTVAIASCGATSENPVYIDDEVRASTTTALIVPLTTRAPAPLIPAQTEIVIEQLSSPENAIAEIMGSGASIDDTVTVDDVVTEFISFEVTPDGGFVASVFIADEGAHTVCVAATCGRVFTLDPGAESLDEVALKIEDAKVAAAEQFDSATAFPDWTIATAGPFSGTGGTTDSETKTITIYSNRNRTIDDFTRTILHEWGHVFDAERLTDDERAEYLELRGIAADTAWTADDDHSIEAWALQPSEDLAEVLALILSSGDYTPRTETLAPAPTDDQLTAIVNLVDL